MGKTVCKFEINDELINALNKIHDFIEATTGKAPDSLELSKVLNRYFILSELGAQTKWERENPGF